MREAIILYDADCGLCCRIVEFLAHRDPHRRLRLSPLDSEHARRLLDEHGLPPEQTQTVVLVTNDRAFTHSTGALRTLRFLKQPWPALSALLAVPRPLRDAVYNWVSRNRRAWFGGAESCPAPSAELRERLVR